MAWLNPAHPLINTDAKWWASIALHEAAHGLVAYELGFHPVSLRLYRAKTGPRFKGGVLLGVCRTRIPHGGFGQYGNVFVDNAPFPANEFTPTGDVGDLHERHDAYHKFCRLTRVTSNALFKAFVDDPLLEFFGRADVQRAVIRLAGDLNERDKVETG
jgi:hypothetical protein